MMRNCINERELKIELPILAQAKYLKNKSAFYGWLENEDFVLPYFLDKRLIFTRMVFTYGLIPKKDELSLSAEKAFMNEMNMFVKEEGLCDFIYKAQSNVVFNCTPDNTETVEWGTYIVDLAQSEEALLSSFHGKHRNVIKNAIKNDVQIEITNDIDLVYEVIKSTLVRQNSIHYPSYEYIKQLQESIGENILLMKALKDGEVQGVALIVYDNHMAYYMYGGSIPRPFTGSLNLLQYEAMKYLKARGTSYYDFVGARINFKKGSKYEGLQRFKSRFGTTLVQGLAFRSIISPWKFFLFNIMSKTYLRIKGYRYTDPIDSIMEEN